MLTSGYGHEAHGEKGEGMTTGLPKTKTCTKCGQPAEDYEWEAGEYWCDEHIVLDTVGRKCMGCDAVLERPEDAEGWYIDNGGQLCPTCFRESEARL